MPINWIAVAVAALIPMLFRFAWYHPKVFGEAWMHSARLTKEDLQGGNPWLTYLLTLIGCFFIAAMLAPVVIHQVHIYSVLAKTPGFRVEGSKIMLFIADFMKQHGNNFRTFGHGALHGSLLGVFFVLPLTMIYALFERRGWKYILIQSGYWILSLALMGGLICGWR